MSDLLERRSKTGTGSAPEMGILKLFIIFSTKKSMHHCDQKGCSSYLNVCFEMTPDTWVRRRAELSSPPGGELDQMTGPAAWQTWKARVISESEEGGPSLSGSSTPTSWFS